MILPPLVFPGVSFRIALTKGKLSLIDEFTLITADEKKNRRRNKKQPKLKSIKNVGPASFGRKPFGRKTFCRETFRRRLHLTNFAMKTRLIGRKAISALVNIGRTNDYRPYYAAPNRRLFCRSQLKFSNLYLRVKQLCCSETFQTTIIKFCKFCRTVVSSTTC